MDDMLEAKAASTGSLPSRRLRFARVKQDTSALALGQTPSVYISVIYSALFCPILHFLLEDLYHGVHHLWMKVQLSHHQSLTWCL